MRAGDGDERAVFPDSPISVLAQHGSTEERRIFARSVPVLIQCRHGGEVLLAD